jgi:PAS domain-containing protein
VLAGSAAFVIAILVLAPDQILRATGPASMSLVAALAWYLLSRGKFGAAVHVLVFGLWATVTSIAFFTGGIRGMAIIVYPQLILILGWLVGTRAAVVMAALAVAATFGFVLAESFGVLPEPPHTPPVMRWIVDSFIFAFSVILIASFVRSYQDRLAQADKLASDLAQRSADLGHAQSVAHVGSWVYEMISDVMHSSPETCRIFGVPEGTLGSSRSYLSRVHPDDRDALFSAWQAALESGAHFDYEHRIVVGDDTRWIRQIAEFELDAERRPLRSVGTRRTSPSANITIRN